MPTQNVNLPTHQAEFIQKRVRAGQYQNASEVVRAGLRLLEQKEQEDQLKLKHLRKLAKEGFAALDRGEHLTLTSDSLGAFFDEVDKTIRSKATSK